LCVLLIYPTNTVYPAGINVDLINLIILHVLA
jgi:hypothetical protein